MTDKEQTIEAHYEALRKIPPPLNNSCYALAVYTTKCLAAIEKLYDNAYTNGFNDALNVKIDTNET
jgi:hypothetical protein